MTKKQVSRLSTFFLTLGTLAILAMLGLAVAIDPANSSSHTLVITTFINLGLFFGAIAVFCAAFMIKKIRVGEPLRIMETQTAESQTASNPFPAVDPTAGFLHLQTPQIAAPSAPPPPYEAPNNSGDGLTSSTSTATSKGPRMFGSEPEVEPPPYVSPHQPGTAVEMQNVASAEEPKASK